MRGSHHREWRLHVCSCRWTLPPQLLVKEVGYHLSFAFMCFWNSQERYLRGFVNFVPLVFFGSGVLCFDFRNHFKYSCFIVPLDRLFTIVPERCIPLFALFLATIGDFLVYFPNFKTLTSLQCGFLCPCWHSTENGVGLSWFLRAEHYSC